DRFDANKALLLFILYSHTVKLKERTFIYKLFSVFYISGRFMTYITLILFECKVSSASDSLMSAGNANFHLSIAPSITFAKISSDWGVTGTWIPKYLRNTSLISRAFFNSSFSE